MLKKDGLLGEGDYSNDYDGEELTEVLLNLADIALTLADKGGAASEISRNLYVSAGKKVSKEAKKEVVKEAVSKSGKQVLKKKFKDVTEKPVEKTTKNILEKNFEYTEISDEMKKKILEGQRRLPNKNEVIGGHSSQINNNNDLFAVEEILLNFDGTKNIKFIKKFADGNI